MKTELSPKMLVGICAAAAVVVIGLMVYFLRSGDPAARPPVPYTKIDYGAHMQQEMRDYNRQPAGGSTQPSPPATP